MGTIIRKINLVNFKLISYGVRRRGLDAVLGCGLWRVADRWIQGGECPLTIALSRPRPRGITGGRWRQRKPAPRCRYPKGFVWPSVTGLLIWACGRREMQEQPSCFFKCSLAGFGLGKNDKKSCEFSLAEMEPLLVSPCTANRIGEQLTCPRLITDHRFSSKLSSSACCSRVTG